MLPPAETPNAPPAEITLPTPEPEPPKKVTPKPRPSPAEAEPAQPKPAAPQISPQLSARDLAAAKARTTRNITTAEKNLQSSGGRELSAAQKDLSEKIRSFLSQAHEAIVAEDWVRAQNLADKARVLSTELVNSF
jgi:outer membrane biosynthesis protein TonB